MQVVPAALLESTGVEVGDIALTQVHRVAAEADLKRTRKPR